MINPSLNEKIEFHQKMLSEVKSKTDLLGHIEILKHLILFDFEKNQIKKI